MKPTNQNPFRSRLAVTSSRVSRFAALAFVLALPWVSSASADTETFNTAGTFNWVCPAGVTEVKVECWGGGGAGGAAAKINSTGNATGAGGGGGAYARNIAVPVTAGSTYTFTIPAAATAPSAGVADDQRFDGGTVTFTGNSVSVTAAGGQGGQSTRSTSGANATGLGGAGGTVLASVGDVGGVFAGGKGGNSGASPSGGGGGGAGDANPGGNGVDGQTTAGVGGLTGGGNGGTGRTGQGPGATGSSPGGGGAGGKVAAGGTVQTIERDGGIGGLGQVILTYSGTPPAAPIVKDDNANDLNLGTSWVLGAAPTATDVAKWDTTVNAANTTLLGADTTWSGIEIADPDGLVTISAGNVLTLGAAPIDINMSAATQDLTLNCDLVLGAANAWNVASGKTLTLGGAVSGAFPLTTQGAGNITLNSTVTGLSSMTAAGTGTVTLNGAVTGLSSMTAAGTGTVTLNGAISGSTTLTTSAAGTVNLGADNAHTGNTTLTAGTLIVGAGGTSGSLGTGTVTGGGNLAFNRSDAVSVSNRIFGTGATTVPKLEIRSGSVTLANTVDNAYLGATVKSGATLVLGATSSSVPDIHAVGAGGTVDLGGTLQLAGTGGDQIYNGADPTINGTFDMAGLSETVGGINGSGSITNTTAATPATLTIGDINSPGSFSGIISDGASGAGGLSLVKIGTGTQTFSGAHTYTGTTAVNGGILNLVTGTGSSTTDTTVAALGTLRTTVTTAGDTWVLGGDLTLNFDSGIQFDFLSVTPSTTTAPLTVVNLDTTSGTIELALLNLNVTAPGEYPLITFTTGPADASGFLPPVLPLNLIGSLKIVGTQLVLDVDEVHTSKALTWTNGDNTGIWDKTIVGNPGDLNWNDTVPAATSFYDTDSVTFDTTAPVGAITASLTVPVNVSGITVSGPHNVTITAGGGSISGTGGVTMNGGGTLDLQMDNSFTGKTVINSGTVVLSSSTNNHALSTNLGAIPAAETLDQITINGGTLVPTTNPSPLFTLDAKNGVYVGASGGTISFPAGKRISIGKLTGHTNAVFTVAGDGTLAFSGDQGGYLGKWILSGTTVVTVAGEGRFGTVDSGPEPDNIKLDGGHIQTTATAPGVTFDDVGRGITLTANGGRLSSSAALNGTYQIVIAGTAGGNLRIGDTGNSNAAQKVTFNAAHTYNGKTYIDRGILAIGASGSIANSPEIVLGGAAPTTFDVSGAPAFLLGAGQTLSGTGSVVGAFASDGIIAPGASTGAISFNSTLGLGAGTLKIEVDDAQTPAVDSISVVGNLNIASATLNLDFNGALTAPVYVIATYGSLSGAAFANITGEAIPAGYALNYNYNGEKKIALVQQGGFGPWIASFFGAETDPNIVGPNADPDKDGVDNIVEFALGGSAPNAGSASPSLFNEIVSDHLTLTVPVLNVATFAGNPLTATVQGVDITAEGSSDLNGFVLAVETTTANPNAPAAPTGYTNHGFRLVQTVTGNPKGFLRMSVK